MSILPGRPKPRTTRPPLCILTSPLTKHAGWAPSAVMWWRMNTYKDLNSYKHTDTIRTDSSFKKDISKSLKTRLFSFTQSTEYSCCWFKQDSNFLKDRAKLGPWTPNLALFQPNYGNQSLLCTSVSLPFKTDCREAGWLCQKSKQLLISGL